MPSFVNHWTGYATLAVFVAAYLLVMVEESIHLRKSKPVMVAVRDDAVVSMAQVAVHGEAAEIDKLFIDPSVLRSGAGRALYEWCIETARKAGAKVVTVDADPEAAPFYRRMGAVDDGLVPSGSIAGRFLPRLKVILG